MTTVTKTHSDKPLLNSPRLTHSLRTVLDRIIQPQIKWPNLDVTELEALKTYEANMSESLDNMSLRDMCKEAERLTRELIDHLEKNMIPRTRELQSLVQPDSPFESGGSGGTAVKDVTVRNQTSALIESQEFSSQLYEKARLYLEAIDRDVSRMMGKSIH